MGKAVDFVMAWQGTPPTRSLGVSKRGRIFVNESYRAWKKQAHRWVSDEVRRVFGVKQPKDLQVNHIAVRVAYYMPNLHKADLDNLIKPVLDALVLAGLVQDDKAFWVRNISAFAVRSDIESVQVTITAWIENEVAWGVWRAGLSEWEQEVADMQQHSLDDLYSRDYDIPSSDEIRLE